MTELPHAGADTCPAACVQFSHFSLFVARDGNKR